MEEDLGRVTTSRPDGFDTCDPEGHDVPDKAGLLIDISEKPTTWESVATVQLLQSLGNIRVVSSENSFELVWLGRRSQLQFQSPVVAGSHQVRYSTPFRQIGGTEKPYIEVLGASNRLSTEIKPLRLDVEPKDDRFILVAPYWPVQSHNLPHEHWPHIVRHLRSYNTPVYVMGERGERLDAAHFTEDEILSNLGNTSKLAIIASACLIIGAPNAWTWLGAALKKKLLIISPDNVPLHRWWWQDGHDIMHLVYESQQLQVPLILTGLRQLIEKL